MKTMKTMENHEDKVFLGEIVKPMQSGDDICEHLRDIRLQFGTQRTQTLSTALQIALICSEIVSTQLGNCFLSCRTW